MMISIGVAYASPEKSDPVAAKKPAVQAEKDDPNAGLSGKVVETMDGGGYTYVCLEQNGKKTWVAMPQTKVVVGSNMTMQPGHEMRNFPSKSLGRTFDSIIFTGGPAASSTVPAVHPTVGASPQGATGSAAQTTAKDKAIKVEKAAGPNAFTVAEVYAKRSELDKKTVAVKGKVVKVSEGILGKNWIHIQDGSGNQKTGTHNLVATTQDMSAVGDIVTITGTFAKDRDFGAGYLYKAIVEDAKVQK
jgi:hypothetical protein